jgi:hypothetical protein
LPIIPESACWICNQNQHRQEDLKTKGDCCFNHIIGLLKKEDNKEEEKPFFDYEKLLYDSLLVLDVYNPLKHTFKLKHLWSRKQVNVQRVQDIIII